MSKEYHTIIPKLSDNLEFNQLTQNEFILSNAKFQHYLKINCKTYNLLSLIDGKKDLKQIIDAYNTKFQKNILSDEVEFLLYEKLSIYGILEGFDHKIKKYQKPAYLKLSFTIIPQKLLSKIVTYFYFLFKIKNTIPILISSILFILTLLYFNIDFYKSFDLRSSLITFFIAMAFSVTFHEIGHATAANFFGAKTGEIGGGFYLFSPVYYTDVTDIWRLNKWQRIVVNLSGVYFEIIFCAILSFIALSIGNDILLLVSITIFICSFFNLMPFLRSDGYWILSDLTNKPNLIHHSFNKFNDLLKLFTGEKIKWNWIDFMLFCYGVINSFLMIYFVYYVLFKNPNSIILFPYKLIEFIKSLFLNDSVISLEKYGELIVPLIFFSLVFGIIKSWIKKGLKIINQNVS